MSNSLKRSINMVNLLKTFFRSFSRFIIIATFRSTV